MPPFRWCCELEKYLEIGEIINTHGVKGELKVMPLTDNQMRYKELNWVYVDINGFLEKYDIESVKFFKQLVILKLKEINDMDNAGKLKGHYLKIDRENAIKLPQDSYFICDLIDCEVFEENGNKLGVLKDVLKTGSNDVYVIEAKNREDILIPALKKVIKDISIESKRITVAIPEGLIDNEI